MGNIKAVRTGVTRRRKGSAETCRLEKLLLIVHRAEKGRSRGNSLAEGRRNPFKDIRPAVVTRSPARPKGPGGAFSVFGGDVHQGGLPLFRRRAPPRNRKGSPHETGKPFLSAGSGDEKPALLTLTPQLVAWMPWTGRYQENGPA